MLDYELFCPPYIYIYYDLGYIKCIDHLVSAYVTMMVLSSVKRLLLEGRVLVRDEVLSWDLLLLWAK